jgi:hypothetical protein
MVGKVAQPQTAHETGFFVFFVSLVYIIGASREAEKV